MNGEAVAGASVSFEPVDGRATSLGGVAETDADGYFTLVTHIGNNEFAAGLHVGEYRVTVSKLEAVTDMRKRPKDLLPAKYKSAKTSPLTAIVKETDNDFSFSLQ